MSCAERAQMADSVVNSVGINTHLTYTNTPYFYDWPTVFSALQYLHIRHIRDGFYPWPEGSVFYTRHQQLKSAGIDTDYVTSAPMPTAEQVAQVQEYAGDMAYLEAPNEMDDQNNKNWASELKSYMPELYKAGSANHVPVLGPSLVYQASYYTLGDIAADMNYNNLHVYFGGRNPGTPGWGNGDAEGHSYGSTPWWVDNGNIDAPGVSDIVTETGYLTPSSVTPYTLPQTVAAKYVPRTILTMFNDGIVKDYSYELMDDSQEYGLYTSALTPKLSAVAVSNMLGFLEDPGANFQTGTLNYTMSGNGSTIQHLLLQKRDGTFWLALWNETPSYNEITNTTINVPTQDVTLTMTDASIVSIDNMTAEGTIQDWPMKNLSSVMVEVTDAVTFVEIKAN